METLTYGLKKPETGDKGSTFFPALEDNFTQLDGHSHDGVDSSLIPSSSIAASELSVTGTGWVDEGDGFYSKAVSFPGAYLNSTSQLRFLLNGGVDDKCECFPKYVVTSNTGMTIYMPTDSQALKVLFT